MSRRSEQLKALAVEFTRIHKEWQADPEAAVITAEYSDSAIALIEGFSTGDIPGDCRELSQAVERFAEEFTEYDGRSDADLMADPGSEFWSAREAIEKVLTAKPKRELSPLPPIAAQAAQGVPFITIAKQYGFKDRNGEWLTHLVQQELDAPGSVLKTPGAVDGRDWVDPRLAEIEASEAVSDHAIAELEAKQVARKKKAAEPCKETPRQLWNQGVLIKQASEMLQKTKAEVEKLYAQFEAEKDKQILAEGAAGAELQAVRDFFAEGMPPDEIAKELKIPKKKVLEIVAKMPKAEEATA